MKTILAVALALALSGCCGPGDAACTEAQYNALGASMLSRPVYSQPRPMVSTSCTTTGGITNCLSF